MSEKQRSITIGIIAAALLVAAVFFFAGNANKQNRAGGLFEFDSGHRLIMGTFARVVAVASDSGTAEKCIEAAFGQLETIELLCSVHRDDSEISRINRDAFKTPVKVSELTFEVLQKADRFSRLSSGAFDITVGPLVNLWQSSAEANSVPTETELAEVCSRVGYEKLILDADQMSVRFAVDGMKLDAGGIAKGYAIDKAIEAMQTSGAAGGMVDVGGDIRCFGTPPEGRNHWLIGLQDPAKARVGISGSEPLLILQLASVDGSGTAVATSGNYQRFALIKGKKYSHIVNAGSGLPSEELASVTVISRSAADADALATAVSVMGAEKGLALIEKIPQTEAILIAAGPESKRYLTSGAQNYISTESIDY